LADVSRWLTPLALIGVAALSVLLPSSVAAHPGGGPFIHVPLTDVAPGSTFSVIVADLGTGEPVTFELVADPPVRLGKVPGTADGHFETTLVLPASTPDGYLQLRAWIADGTEATTWIHVATSAPSAGVTSGDSFEYVPYLAAGLAIAALGVLLLRTRRPSANRPPTG
jgi:hypothetical protein